MQAMMLITVRVAASQAQRELARVEAQHGSLQREIASSQKAARNMSYGLPQMSKWGNQVQWAGRQLQYNFTLPLVLAAGAATKFQLDNEKAMTRVVKVYGDASHSASEYRAEIDALSKSFEALSNRYGVAQSDVINIAADWAAAGASGVALARATKLTLETMVLGEMEAADATKALIAIQAQYGYSTKELAKTIDVLNMVENQTGISMQGLVEGFQRAAGVARSTGVDVEHLAAMLASLVPASGSAANAGNALKTIMSRLLSPTKEAAEVMGLMGVRTDDVNWKNLTAAQRLELMADKYQELGKGVEKNSRALDSNGKATGRLISSQQAIVSSVIASRWQINRWDVLMRDIANRHGYYQKALNSTADAQKNFNQRVYELNTVLKSNPQRLKQMWVILQNAMADVVQPLIPYIVYLAQEVAKLGQAFADMNPLLQKTILFGLLFLAAVGPIARYVGSVTNLFGILAAVLHFVAARLGLVAVATVGANGAMVMQRKGLIGLMMTWLAFAAMPFLKIFGLIGSGLIGLGKLFLAFPKFVASARLAIAAFALAYGPAFAVARTVMGAWVAYTKGMWAAILGYAAIARVKMFAINMSMSLAGAGVFARMWAMIGVIWQAGMMFVLGLQRGWLVSLAMMSVTAKSMVAIWRGTWAAIVGIAAIARTRLLILSALHAAGQIGIWARLRGALLIIVSSMMKGIAVIWKLGILGMIRTSAMIRAIPLLFTRLVPMIAAALFSLPGLIALAIAAAIGVLYHFRDQVGAALSKVVEWVRKVGAGTMNALRPLVDGFWEAANAIQRAFWSLPKGIRDAMLAVINIIRQAALAVYEWFSYLNPWARHSPSLVESVTTGMDAIEKQYARAGRVGAIFAKASRDLHKFQDIAMRMKVAEATKNSKGSGALAGALLYDYKALLPIMNSQEAAVNRQQAVVDKWEAALDRANDALDRQQEKLDGLEKVMDGLQAQYDKHKDAMDRYASATISGMGAADDAIFANTQAQKQLQLQMLQWEQVHGSVDDVKNSIAMLQGEIENLNGMQSDLRSAGAGSEITGPIQDQIDQLREAAGEMTDSVNNSPMAQWQKQLDKLNIEGQIMELQKALKFDGPIREIDKLVNGMNEMPFEQIIAGVQRERAALDSLQPKMDAANAAIDRQKALVDAATASRDALQSRYDTERKQLDALTKSYEATRDMVNELEQALNQLAQARDEAERARKAKEEGKLGGKENKLTPGGQNFMDAAGGGFPDPGSLGKIGREGGWGDQSKLIDEFTKGITDDLAKSFGSMDIFGPIKKWWNKAWSWIRENIGPVVMPIVDGIKGALGNLKDGWNNLMDTGKVQGAFGKIGDAIKTIWDWGVKIAKLFGPDIQRVWNALVDAGKKIWNEIGPELAKFIPLLKPIWEAIKPLAQFIGGALVLAFKLLASMFTTTLGPVLDAALDIIENVIQVIRGLVEFVVGAVNGDWKMAFQGLWDIVSGTFGAIWNFIVGIVMLIWKPIEGLFRGIWEIAKWVWNELLGHSIIPDIVNGMIAWFQLMIDTVKPIWDVLVWIVKEVVAPAFKFLWDTVKNVASWIGTAISLAWDIIKPIWDAIVFVIKNVLGPTFRWLWDNVISPVWGWIKDKIVGAWNLIQPTWENMKSGAGLIGSKMSDLWAKIREVWDSIKSKISGVWDNLKGVFERFKDIPGDIGRAFGGLGGKIKDVFGDIKSAIGGAVDWIRGKIDWMMDKLGDVKRRASSIGGSMFGDWDFNFGFAKGGVIPYATGGQVAVRGKNSGPFETRSPVALVGEGSRRWREFVIPTDPRFRKRAIDLWQSAGRDLGVMASDAVLFSNGGNVTPLRASGRGGARQEANTGMVWSGDAVTTINIYGNLEFPNITDGGDAEEFIENLKDLAG